MNPRNPPSGPGSPPGDERHTRVREQLGGYVLGQLAAGERAAIDNHLRGCPSCREEIDALAPLVGPLAGVDPDDLGELAHPAVPAPDLFPAILRRIHAEQTEHAEPVEPAGSSALDAGTAHLGADVNTGATDTEPEAAAPAGSGNTGSGEVVAFRSRRPRPRLRSQLVVAAAGLVIALTGVSVGVAIAPDAANAPVETVAVQTLTPGVDARAGLIGHTWGVEMKLTATGFAPGQTYRAAVLDDTGRPVAAGAFVGTGRTEMRCNLTSSLLREQASGFVVTDAAGTPVLVSRFA